MNFSLFDTPSRCFQLEHPRRPFPVMPSLVIKRKGEAPKCKTCRYFEHGWAKWGMCTVPMQMACNRYERKNRKK